MNARRTVSALVLTALVALLAACAAPVHPEPWDAVADAGVGLPPAT
jgi:hypothetical protein